MRVGPHSMVTAAELMVMPLAFSSGSKSVVVLPSSTSPTLCLEPLKYRIRSVVVVLPASTWAMMPMLRRFSSMVRGPLLVRRRDSSGQGTDTEPEHTFRFHGQGPFDVLVNEQGSAVSEDVVGAGIANRWFGAKTLDVGSRERRPGWGFLPNYTRPAKESGGFMLESSEGERPTGYARGDNALQILRSANQCNGRMA